jgi:hypothetical protein
MPLDFTSTQDIRNKLLRKNLTTPYAFPSTVLPISYTSSSFVGISGAESNVIQSDKIKDGEVVNLLTAEFRNAYTPITPYVFPTLPKISIVLNRRGIYPIFSVQYKYDEVIGRTLNEGTSFEESGDLTGGFTWRSTSIKNDINPKDKSNFQNSLSTNYNFRDDSIMNATQKIMNATPQGAEGRGHVGNAIDQTSRIFSDGRKLISKGSAIKYVDKFNGTEGGAEYARVWTKDRPYSQFGDTMKRKGNIRKFTESILDSPYNLNIAPQNGSTNFEGSTNMQKTGDGFFAKKYMLSIENLAWKTSNRFGFRYEDLPYAERGPNGGRVMWFPPYGVQVQESNSAKWNDNSFLGRVEPVYTYQGAERGGTLSFKIVVDHPSVLNVLVRKKFHSMSDAEANNYIMAFFAGAVDVDIYDLARRYTSLDRDDIERILAYVNGNKPTVEMYKTFRTVVPTATESTVVSTDGYTEATKKPTVYFLPNSDSFFDFDNDVLPYEATLASASATAGLTTGETANYKSEVETAFAIATYGQTDLDTIIAQTKKNLGQGDTAVISLYGSANPNESILLSAARMKATKLYILNALGIDYSDNDVFDVPFRVDDVEYKTQLTFKQNDMGDRFVNALGESCVSPTFTIKGKNNATLTQYIANSFYCRGVKVYATYTKRNIIAKKNTDVNSQPQTIEDTFSIERPAVPSLDEAKRLLTKLLGEEYYFDTIRDETPHIFSSLKEKLKYFHPSFHSTTPEGLNSRLTFLIQCTRPGDTIPIVHSDGERVVEDARNTAFGPPPICVLRVGDFYHSKIIIRDVQINYEDNIWDMNPEGIGVQPMIANVNMNITFIGGQGLKQPVAELQNALSSSFFANTEMYDYRATATEDREKFNKEFLQQLIDSSDSVKKADIKYPKQSSYGDPIGKFKNKDVNSSGSTFGTLEYTTLISDSITALNTYGTSASDFYNTMYKKWGKTIASMALAETNRSRHDGTFLGTTFKILGVHNGLSTQPDVIVSTIADGIRDMNFDVFATIKNQLTTSQYDLYKSNFENSFMETFKTELTDLIKTDFNNGENKLHNNQLTLIQLIDKINLVNQKVDGTVTEEKTTEFTLSSGISNIMNSYFSPYLNSFQTMYTYIQSKLTNQNVDLIAEDTSWRVNIMTSYFTENKIIQYMTCFEGLGDAKMKKIKETLKNYLKSKEEKVDSPKSIININKTVEFSFTENPSAPNASILGKIFQSGDASTGGTYNFSNLV